MERFARTAEAIAARPGKLDKIAVLAEYFGTLDDADLVAAARFFTGVRLPRATAVRSRSAAEPSSTSRGACGSSTTPRSAQRIARPATWERRSRRWCAPPRDATLFADRLTPAALDAFFGDIGDVAGGKSAGKRREAIFERILRACNDPAAAAYVVKIVTGDLRVGLREGLVLDAIARAFGAEQTAVRRATMASGDVGAVALAAKHGTLDQLRIAYGTPIGFMLASPIAYAQTYGALDGANWIVEDKYDGIRAQAHVRDDARAAVLTPAQRRERVLPGNRGGAWACVPRAADSRWRDFSDAQRPGAAVSPAPGALAAQERRRRRCSATCRWHTSSSICLRSATSF